LKVEFEGKYYEVQEIYVICSGGCGKKFGPIVVEKGTKASVICLPCKIKEAAKKQMVRQ